MGNLAQLDQETGLGVNCLIKFDKILLIGIGGVNKRVVNVSSLRIVLTGLLIKQITPLIVRYCISRFE